MKTVTCSAIIVASLALTFVSSALTESADPPATTGLALRRLGTMPLTFTENQGQWDERVKFRANAGGITMWFTGDGANYQFVRHIQESSQSAHKPACISHDELEPKPDSLEQLIVRATFVDANRNPVVVGDGMTEYKCNYFIGNDPEKWRTDVPNYREIVYEGIYEGIDLKYYDNGEQMEYDFVVSPGADPDQIRVRYAGAESISVNDAGELVVETKWGTVTETRPMIYQSDENSLRLIDGQYVLFSDNTFGFDFNQCYDPTLALVIDPELSYSTYLGGSVADSCTDIAVDESCAAYVVGYTYSSDFPTQDAYQNDLVGATDVFVTKLSSTGSSLVYSTYLGGTGNDRGFGIAVDGSGNAYVTGYTGSSDFPTENAYQATSAVLYDAFVTKLSSSGSSLVYSTYLGGSSSDRAFDIAVDGSGNAYVTGYTGSTDFPTENPFQTDDVGDDAFVTKLSSSGTALVYSTYLAGSLLDAGQGIAVDDAGNAYVTGYTSSTDFPTENPYQTYLGPYDGYDVFVTKLNPAGTALVYSTYLAGSSTNEQASGIAVGVSGNAYVTGFTWSTDFPTENPYQTYLGQGDVFVTKLSSAGNALVYSTYLGGSADEAAYDIAVDGSGNAYVTGCTQSTDFPMQDPYQADELGALDAFVTRLNTAGDALVFSTYLGGSDHLDYGTGIAVDGFGNAYVTGLTFATDFPTQNPYQTDQGSVDGFVSKLSYPLIRIQRALNGEPTQNQYVSITIEHGPLYMSSFDLNITLDTSKATLLDVEPGQLLEDCEWGSFGYAGVPSASEPTYSIWGTAGEAATCYGPPDSDPHELAEIEMLIQANPGEEIPIRFNWVHCGSNALTGLSSDTIYYSKRIYDYDGTLLWDEDEDVDYPEATRPEGLGTPDTCLGNPSIEESRHVNYMNGSVQIPDSGYIDYTGTVRMYVVEPSSRWENYDGLAYHFGFLGFALDAEFSLGSDGVFDTTVVWDAAAAGYGDVTEDNILAITAVFDDDYDMAWSYIDPDNHPFEAYEVDAVAAAVPGETGYNETEPGFTHTMFVEQAEATWVIYSLDPYIWNDWSTGDYPFYYATFVVDQDTTAENWMLEHYNIYGCPMWYFDGGYRVQLGEQPGTQPLTDSLEACGTRPVPDLNLSISTTWLAKGGLEVNVHLEASQWECGDADASGSVDIDDVVYLIAFIFSGGPEPVPYESGDTDCSGGVDIDDVVYLIAYIFSGGNESCDTDGDQVPDC